MDSRNISRLIKAGTFDENDFNYTFHLDAKCQILDSTNTIIRSGYADITQVNGKNLEELADSEPIDALAAAKVAYQSAFGTSMPDGQLDESSMKFISLDPYEISDHAGGDIYVNFDDGTYLYVDPLFKVNPTTIELD